MAQLNYPLDDDLHQKLRLVAVVNGRSLKAEVVLALQSWVEREMAAADWNERVQAST